MTASEAYNAIAKLGREHALIHQAAGGVIVIVHPDTQREAGIYGMCQYMAGLGPHPDSVEASPSESQGELFAEAPA